MMMLEYFSYYQLFLKIGNIFNIEVLNSKNIIK